MIRTAFPLALAATAMAATPAMADVTMQANGPVISLSVTETSHSAPDIVTVGAGVTSEAPTAVAAMQANAQAMAGVIGRIKALGIAEKDIQTTGISLNPRYDYDQDSRQQVFRGYQVSNRVSVVLRKVERTGEVLDALVAAGATDISGPSFDMADATTARASARKAALDTAKAQAMDYARWAGYSNIRLLEVSESISGDFPHPVVQVRAMDAAKLASTPVQPGEVGTSVTISVKYEMVQ
ncbi:MAG: SIMPL domain-containing protein [Sphingomonadales bacterium]|nr:SIMPL domain-containing protein [Sphingomonadales bacterium]MBD3775318.1 SIMPL domain-containing protein [Paracoccaceae bacterium]